MIRFTMTAETWKLNPTVSILYPELTRTVNGSPRAGLTRFNADDSIDTTFNAASVPNSTTTYHNGIELLNDGRIIVSQLPNNFIPARAAYLNTDGSLIKIYDENADYTVNDHIKDVADVAFQADGKSYILDGLQGLIFIDTTRTALAICR